MLVGSKPKPKSAFQNPGAPSESSHVESAPCVEKSALHAMLLGSENPGWPELVWAEMSALPMGMIWVLLSLVTVDAFMPPRPLNSPPNIMLSLDWIIELMGPLKPLNDRSSQPFFQMSALDEFAPSRLPPT